jgi:hypothetical protein
MHSLNAYIGSLLEQPAYISRCNFVKLFFAPREGDYEIGPEEVLGPKEEIFSPNSFEGRISTSGRTIKIHDHQTVGWDEGAPHASDATWEEYAGSRRERAKGKRETKNELKLTSSSLE